MNQVQKSGYTFYADENGVTYARNDEDQSVRTTASYFDPITTEYILFDIPAGMIRFEQNGLLKLRDAVSGQVTHVYGPTDWTITDALAELATMENG